MLVASPNAFALGLVLGAPYEILGVCFGLHDAVGHVPEASPVPELVGGKARDIRRLVGSRTEVNASAIQIGETSPPVRASLDRGRSARVLRHVRRVPNNRRMAGMLGHERRAAFDLRPLCRGERFVPVPRWRVVAADENQGTKSHPFPHVGQTSRKARPIDLFYPQLSILRRMCDKPLARPIGRFPQ